MVLCWFVCLLSDLPDQQKRMSKQPESSGTATGGGGGIVIGSMLPEPTHNTPSQPKPVAATATGTTSTTSSGGESAAAGGSPAAGGKLVIPDNIRMCGAPIILCYTLLGNILTAPSEPRYRRFKAEKVVPNLLLPSGGTVNQFKLVQVLTECGFVVRDGWGEYELPLNAPLEPLRMAVQRLPTILNPYTQKSSVIPVKMVRTYIRDVM